MGMRCIRCDTDNNLSDRNLNRGLCKNCRHPFVFEPAIMKGVQFTDRFFANAIQDISADNTFYFTPKQLFYLLRKRLDKTPYLRTFTGFFISGLSILFIGTIASSENPGFFIFILVGLGVVINTIYRIQKTEISRIDDLNQEQLQAWLNSWLQVNDTPKLLNFAAEESALTPINSDISAYSFDRAVICDNDAIAKFLIANNFHFENNCAVLSITGYPHSIFTTVIQMLRRNPELKVYAIHDASPSGVTLVHYLRTTPEWFQNKNVIIYDLGLLPRQIIAQPKLFVQTSSESAQQAKQLPTPVQQALSSAELKWLEEGKFLELESFTPQRIIKILNQGILRSQNVADTDRFLLTDDGESYIYSYDSFG